MICKYCHEEIFFGPGCFIIERNNETIFAHEECIQQAQDDDGLVKLLHKDDDEDDYGIIS